MAQCTDAERKILDAALKSGADYIDIGDLSYATAMERAPADFFEQAVTLFMEKSKVSRRHSEFFDRAVDKHGFSAGQRGGMVRLWDAAEKEAERRLKEGT